MERLQDEAALDRPLDRDSVARLIELGRWRGAANEGVFDGDQAAQLAEDLAEILRDTKIPADESAAAAQLLSMFLRCCDDGLFLVALPD